MLKLESQIAAAVAYEKRRNAAYEALAAAQLIYGQAKRALEDAEYGLKVAQDHVDDLDLADDDES